MDSRDSWIDPDEVSELAGELYPESGEPPEPEEEEFAPLPLLDDEALPAASEMVGQPVEDAGEGEEGKAARMGEQLRLIRERAVRSGLLVGAEAKPESGEAADDGVAPEEGGSLLEPFVLPRGRLVEQVEALVRWLSDAGDQVFVLDELGDELVSGDVPAGLRSGAVRLAQSWERSQSWLREEQLAAAAPLASATLAGGQVLSVVGVRCASGFYCAALLRESMITAAQGARVRDALYLVFS